MHYSRYMINDFNYHFKASGKIKNGARWQRDLISAALWSGCHATRFPSGLWVSSTEPRRPTRPLFPLASIFIRHWCSTNGFWVDAVNTTIWQGFMKSDRNIIKYALNLTTGIVECLTMFVVAYHVWRGRVCCCYGMLGRCIIQKKRIKVSKFFCCSLWCTFAQAINQTRFSKLPLHFSWGGFLNFKLCFTSLFSSLLC